MTDRPHIRTEPGMRFGGPHLRGIGTDAIADLIVAGEGPDAVCDNYGISRHELAVVLWFEGEHGSKRHRKALGVWADGVYGRLAQGDVDGLEMPEFESPA